MKDTSRKLPAIPGGDRDDELRIKRGGVGERPTTRTPPKVGPKPGYQPPANPKTDHPPAR